MLENGAPRCSEVEVWDHKLMDGGEIPKVVSPGPRKVDPGFESFPWKPTLNINLKNINLD